MASKKSGKNDNDSQDKPKHRVIRHHGKSTKLPDEIQPGVKKDVISNPIDVGINPAKNIKSSPAGESPETAGQSKENEGERLSEKAVLPREGNQPPKQNGGWVLGFALLLSFVALGMAGGVSYFLYHVQQNMQQLQQTVQTDQGKVNDLLGQAKTALNQVKSLQEQFDTNQTKLVALKQEIETAQSQFIASTGKKDWVLNTVQNLVQNAHEQIAINRDIATAYSQLALADSKLKDLGHPKLNYIRSALSQDMLKLNSVESIDKAGIWSKLNAISKELQGLSFKTLLEESSSQSLPPSDGSGEEVPKWQEALNKSWDQVKSLIRVSRYDQDQITPLLTEHEEMQLRYMMQYMVEQAKWGVLKYDNAVYQEALTNLNDKLTFFYEENNAKQTVLNEIAVLKTQNIAPTLPDVAASLEAIQKAIDSKDTTLSQLGGNE